MENYYVEKQTDNESGIYIIVNIVDAKAYVGKATNLSNRTHKQDLRKKFDNQALQADYDKGVKLIYFKIFYDSAPNDYLFNYEKFYMTLVEDYGGFELYNSNENPKKENRTEEELRKLTFNCYTYDSLLNDAKEHIDEDFLHYPDLPFIDIPKVCPVCGGETEVRESISGTKELLCLNSNCSGKLINRLDHFCGKKGLDIKGVSKATLEKLIDWGWISSYADIFELSTHKDEWVKKPGFGIKSVEKVLDAINTGANCELYQFIAALGIPLIGTTASKELAKYFETWEKFFEAATGGFDFYTLPNFGSEMHNSIVCFNYAEASLLANHYIHFITPEEVPLVAGESLANKTFVITGKLIHFKNRNEIKAHIEALGGKVVGSVSKNTDYLINNDVNSTSSKNLSAKSLGIPILSEDDFIQTFGIK